MGGRRIASEAGRAGAKDGSQQLAGHLRPWEPACTPVFGCDGGLAGRGAWARGGRESGGDVRERCACLAADTNTQPMLSHGFEMWSRAGREISAMFAQEGDPLTALSKLSPPVPVLHVYAQPPAPEYLSTQESFARDHPWFHVRRLEAASQFPTLEVPDETARVVREFVQ